MTTSRRVVYLSVILVAIYLLVCTRHKTLSMRQRIHKLCAPFNKYFVVRDILKKSECDWLVQEAEAHARDNGGWTKKRHEHYPTTDLEIDDIPACKLVMRNIVRDRIYPRIAALYGVDINCLYIDEIFVAKYSADEGSQASLEYHTDESEFSFVIPLNDGFEGGGTRFEATKDRVKPETGHALIFPGNVRHEGMAVTKGTRYIAAGFLKYADAESNSDDEP